ISLGGIVASRWIRIAGDEMDQDIVTYMRQRYNLLIGERMAEEVKIASASTEAIPVRGRELKSGLPAEVQVAADEVREAISGSVNAILDAVTDTIEETPPELVADLMARGITVAGGGSLLPGLVERLAERTRMRVTPADDPLGCVVRGTGKVLNEIGALRKVLLHGRSRGAPGRQ
ncbi:MAG: rod shape-determining protein, partial [Chloroflexota bacterium]|nr:rod shape-determining protein [Chloroflexota bacterium]